MKKFRYDFDKISKLGCRLVCIGIFILVQLALLWRVFFAEPFAEGKEFFKGLKWRYSFMLSDYFELLRAVKKSFLSGVLNEKRKVSEDEE